MEELFEKSIKRIAQTDVSFVRSIKDRINWNARLIGVKGSRGVGKTTLLLQYIKLELQHVVGQVLFVSLDNIWFSENKLVTLVDDFVKRGGRYLFLDEVHKYPNWSVELKNIYDDNPELNIVFTGSSLLEILNSRADLSRRAVIYQMQGLSFREYLNIELKADLPAFSLSDILNNHLQLSQQIVSKLRPLQYFRQYLEHGYYPFYQEVNELYFLRLEEVINLIMEIELPMLRNVNPAYINRLKQLLYIVSESAPFVPNVSKISERIGINRETLLGYIYYLNEANILFSAYQDAKGITQLQKPDKIFLENTNLMYAFKSKEVNIGNIRETFFANQLRNSSQVELSPYSDFLVDSRYTFEVGGQSKKKKQIENLENAYIVSDDIEFGFGNKIPLWLFGFLY